MATTSTTFQKGHPPQGGRPKGTKTGAGKNAWRLAGKRVAHLASRIDEVESELLATSETLTPVQHARLSGLLRDRQKYYEERSKYVRRLVRTGGIEFVFPNGVTSRTWKRNDLTTPPPAGTKKPTLLTDKVGRKAVKKIRQIDRQLATLQDGLSRIDFTNTTGPAEANARLATLRYLMKSERDLLRRSQDPRPVVLDRPFQIVFTSIPCDPFYPDVDKPLRLLGGRRRSEFWTDEEFRADRERIARDRERLELENRGLRFDTERESDQVILGPKPIGRENVG